MSYDKNTIVTSHIDAIVRALDATGRAYNLTTIGSVRCLGNNDLGIVPLRRLEFADRVVLERCVQTEDCDDYDIVESIEFTRDSDPGDMWKCVVSEWDVA